MKRFSAIGLGLLLTLSLVGCASNKANSQASAAAAPVAINNQDDIVQADLNYAAQSVNISLSQLAEIEKSNHQGNLTMPFDNISDPTLAQPIVITWYGPIAPILATVANKVGYKLQVYGKPPQTPVMVDIDTTQSQTSALDALRNLDLQAGQNANILIYTDTKIISLRYTAT